MSSWNKVLTLRTDPEIRSQRRAHRGTGFSPGARPLRPNAVADRKLGPRQLRLVPCMPGLDQLAPDNLSV